MVTARRQKLRPNRARERAKIARKMGTTKGDHGLLMKTTSMKRVRQLEREARRKIKSVRSAECNAAKSGLSWLDSFHELSSVSTF